MAGTVVFTATTEGLILEMAETKSGILGKVWLPEGVGGVKLGLIGGGVTVGREVGLGPRPK